MKYKVKAFYHDGKWESKYIEPEGSIIGRDLVQIAQSHLLKNYFETEEDANNYTFNFLDQKGITKDNIEIIIN